MLAVQTAAPDVTCIPPIAPSEETQIAMAFARSFSGITLENLHTAMLDAVGRLLCPGRVPEAECVDLNRLVAANYDARIADLEFFAANQKGLKSVADLDTQAAEMRRRASGNSDRMAQILGQFFDGLTRTKKRQDVEMNISASGAFFGGKFRARAELTSVRTEVSGIYKAMPLVVDHMPFTDSLKPQQVDRLRTFIDTDGESVRICTVIDFTDVQVCSELGPSGRLIRTPHLSPDCE